MSAVINLHTEKGRKAWLARIFSIRSDEEFTSAAKDLFQLQTARCKLYARLAKAHGLEVDRIKDWRQIPAVPQALFKEVDLYTGSGCPGHEYHTSGTTSGRPGRQFLWKSDMYRAVANAGFEFAGLSGCGKLPLFFLAPSPREAPRSSLSAMFGFWQKRFGTKKGGFFVKHGLLQTERFLDGLNEAIGRKSPLGIGGPAFAFVPLLESGLRLCLPSGSWILETGGFKGRTREIEKPEFYRALKSAFGMPETRIHNEYGMTELSSQAYARGVNEAHRVPAWARVLVVNPSTGQEVGIGDRGVVRWIDLANVDSILGIQTMDFGVRERQGFRLLGRVSSRDRRGCSLAAESWGVV